MKEKEDDPGSKKSNWKAQKEADLDDDLLPANGLYTLDGHLFYHTTPIQLTKSMYKRAEENGINLRSSTNFSLEESVQIFRNWHQFCESSNIQIDKVMEYVKAKTKKDSHILQHQEEHQFWVKLCHGLPHRSCQRVKARVLAMMTDDFLKTLGDDWTSSNLLEKIRARFYKYEAYDEVAMQKMLKLLERGYTAAHAGEILDVPATKAINMSAKLKMGERRDDQDMLRRFYESAVNFGLNPQKIHEHVLDDNEIQLDRLRQNVKIEELGFRMHLSPNRCRDLLKKVLSKILNTFRDSKKEDATDEEAWREAIEEFSPKTQIRNDQIAKALEIFCHEMTKNDTIATLKHNESMEKILKSEGLTGFQCDNTEFHYVHSRVCYDWLVVLEREFFRNLRRGFRAQIKLHCLLWAYKRMEIWEGLEVEEGKTRYQAVLEAELANPWASKMTLRFLKNEKVCEWIMDPRPPKHRRNQGTLRMEACVEAFILYTFKKFGGNFKFPKKLRPLVGETSSPTIQNLLKEILDSENSEYLTMKEVKEAVEKASGKEIGVKMRNKAIVRRVDVDSGDSGDSEEDSDDVDHLLEHSRQMKDQKSEELKLEIANILEKADPSKIRRKYRNREADDDVEEIWLSEEILRQKRVMERIAVERNAQFQSKEFVSDESSSDEEEEKKQKGAESEEEDRNPYDFVTDSDMDEDDNEDGKCQDSSDGESVSEPQKTRKGAEPEAPEDSEARRSKKGAESEGSESKKKKRKNRESEVDSSAEAGDSGPQEPQKKKKKMMDDSEDVRDSESESGPKKKKKKRKRRDSEAPDDVQDTESQNLDFEAPEDTPDSESKKKKDKKKKRKHRDSEAPDDVQDSEAPLEDTVIDSESQVPEFEAPNSDSESKSKKKKDKKKRTRRDSEVLETEDPMDSEAGRKEKKKKRRRRDSEAMNPDDVGAPDDLQDSEDVEKPKKHKKKKKKEPEDHE